MIPPVLIIILLGISVLAILPEYLLTWVFASPFIGGFLSVTLYRFSDGQSISGVIEVLVGFLILFLVPAFLFMLILLPITILYLPFLLIVDIWLALCGAALGYLLTILIKR